MDTRKVPVQKQEDYSCTSSKSPVPLLVTISIEVSSAKSFLSLVMNASRLREAK